MARRAVALFRAVNLPSHNSVGAADLRRLFESLGFDDVRTLLQTGNVVFLVTGSVTPATLERRIEQAAARLFGLQTDVMVRDAAAWREIVRSNPFPDEARDDPSHLVVLLLKSAPRAGGVEALRTGITGRERVAAGTRALYLVYPDGIGRSKVTNIRIERAIGVSGTGRNWNTVLKIDALL
jgi:uncharacterized protein (DUF1697 family)